MTRIRRENYIDVASCLYSNSMNLPSWRQHNENKWPYRQTNVSWEASSELNTIQKRDFSNVTPLPNFNLTIASKTQPSPCLKSLGIIGKVNTFRGISSSV